MSFRDVESNVWNRIAFQFIDEGNNISRDDIHRNYSSETLNVSHQSPSIEKVPQQRTKQSYDRGNLDCSPSATLVAKL